MKDYRIYYLINSDGHKEIHHAELSAENPIQALKAFDEIADEFQINVIERTDIAPSFEQSGCFFGLTMYTNAVDCGQYIRLD